ncbi:MAG TPA: YggT family protein [Candidatus Hydrogenedentes bacterium]|nr:YggT family protein [Candidatus Hydrogenedentota bacterium]
MSDETVILREVARLTVYSGITLYMMAILIRWTAPFLSLNLYKRGVRIIPAITDPFLKLVRRILPPMGFVDWSPVAAVLILWVVRVVLVRQ